MAKIYYSKRTESRMSKEKKSCGETSGGNQAQASLSAVIQERVVTRCEGGSSPGRLIRDLVSEVLN